MNRLAHTWHHIHAPDAHPGNPYYFYQIQKFSGNYSKIRHLHLTWNSSWQEIPNKCNIFYKNKPIPGSDCRIEGCKKIVHFAIIQDDKISNIEKIGIFLKFRNMNRKLKKKKKLIMNPSILFEKAIYTTIITYHSLWMKCCNKIKGSLFKNMRSHYFYKCRNLWYLFMKNVDYFFF